MTIEQQKPELFTIAACFRNDSSALSAYGQIVTTLDMVPECDLLVNRFELDSINCVLILGERPEQTLYERLRDQLLTEGSLVKLPSDILQSFIQHRAMLVSSWEDAGISNVRRSWHRTDYSGPSPSS
jgi:hypothetical protein